MRTITLVIERFDGKKSYTQEYQFPHQGGLTILASLIRIRETLDPTLNFTAACRSAICGACAVRVNGNAVLACDTMLDEQLDIYGSDTLTIAPLGNFKVISDLVVDWEPSMENLRRVKPGMTVKSEFTPESGCRQSNADFEKVKLLWDCILCGCCASECNKLEWGQDDFMQPFVYTHAERAAIDSRTKDPMLHARPAHDKGLWKCVRCVECINKCPKKIKPGESIANLRGLTVKAGMTEGVGPAHGKAFLKDLEETGRLNEVKLALRTEGMLGALKRTPFALRLLCKGKLNPLELFANHKIEGHDALLKMIASARKEG